MLWILTGVTLLAPAVAFDDDDTSNTGEFLPTIAVLVEDPHSGELRRAADLESWPTDRGGRSSTVVLPELHESELVGRLAPGSDHLFLWNSGSLPVENVTLTYVDHPQDSLVVMLPDGPSLLTDIGLPLDAWDPVTERSVLPEIARLDGSTYRAGQGSAPAESRRREIDADTNILPGSSGIPSLLVRADESREPYVLTSWPVSRCSPTHEENQLLAAYGLSTREGLLALGSASPRIDRLLLASAEPLQGLEPVSNLELRSRPLTEDGVPTPGSTSKLATLADWSRRPDRLLEIGFESQDPIAEGSSRTWLLTVTIPEFPKGIKLDQVNGAFERHLARLARWDAAWDVTRLASTPTDGRFRDATKQSGISHSHMEGPAQQLDIRPTMGPGAAWGDVDGDGFVDLYLVQGGGREGSEVPRNRLFRNLGGSTFEDVTIASGTGDQGAGMGALFCDLDSDGDLDLYVANYGRDVLYWNDGSGVFTRSEGQLPDLDLWSAGVAASDYDRDGDLDLYITSYLDYDESKMPPADELGRYSREDPVAMLPFAFPGQRNVFLRNDVREDGTRVFSDVTEELGLLDAEGRGMQAIFWDFDQDGDDDLYIANDVSYNALHRNEGGGTFRDVTFLVGLDDPRGGMGLSIGDVDRDGDEDLFLTNWQLEANALYVNNLINRAGRKRHTGTFADHTVQSRLGPAGIGVTSWGSELFDADNDGDLDLFVANGYTSPDYESTGICVGQPNHFFLNDGRGRFRAAHEELGATHAEKLASRGAVACDYDQDGLLDLLVTANNGRVQLLHNQSTSLGHWLVLRLAGSNGNTHAIGARIHAFCGDDEFVASLRAGTGYLTGNPAEIHLGLGAHETIDRLEIHWPSGRTTTHEGLAVDRVLTIAEQQ